MSRLPWNGGVAARVASSSRAGGNARRTGARPRPGDQLPALTGIRGVAACIVAVFHMNYWFYAGHWGPHGPGVVLATMFRVGYLSVDLFFALSGYVIAGAYLEAFRRPSGAGYAHFMIRRFARVWPLHALTLLLLLGQPDCRAPGDIMGNLLMVHSWGLIDHPTCNEPSWSISCEWFAYLGFPVLAWVLLRCERRLASLAVAACALGGLGVLAWLNKGHSLDVTFDFGLARAACGFTIGAALCRGFADARPGRAFDAAGLALLAAIGVLAAQGAPDILVACLFGPLVVCVARAAGPLRAALGAGPLVWLGEISYSLYLLHHLMIDRFHDLGGEIATPAAVGLALCAIIGVAALSRRWIERPARDAAIRMLGRLLPASRAA